MGHSEWWSDSLAGTGRMISHQNPSFLSTTKTFLSRQNLFRGKHFCRDKTFVTKNICRDKHNFVAMKLLSQQTGVCRDKTRLLSLQKYACHNNKICRDKFFFGRDRLFVATKAFFRGKHSFVVSLAGTATSTIFVVTNVLSQQIRVFHDKHVFFATKVFLRDKTFVTTNIILSRYRRGKSFVATNTCLSRQK